LIVCAVMVGANSAFAAIFFFPSNDLFNVERKGCFFNPFRSLLVCAFFIGSGKNRQNTGWGDPEGSTIRRKTGERHCAQPLVLASSRLAAAVTSSL
jgi:hypothetical protein